MRNVLLSSLVSRTALTSAVALLASGTALAQNEPPLPPLPEEPASAESAPTASEPPAPSGARVIEPTNEPANAAAAKPVNSREATTSSTPEPGVLAPTDGATGTQDDEESKYKEWSRKQSTRGVSSLSGGLGLLRTQSASGGEAGQFRFGLLAGFFSGGGFLCSPSAPCADPVTGLATESDSAQRTEGLATISATPFSFLEAYLVIRNSATSDDRSRPGVLQILGDSFLGVKAFLPVQPDRIFYFGGALELLMLSGSGGVGLQGSATGFGLKGLASLDLTNRLKEEDRIPLRAHFNFGYTFDNSSAIVSAIEATPRPTGRGGPVARTERYGLNISRVDALQVALGAEYVNDWVRPFLEWSIDVPVNRQGYVCNINSAASRGDWCLGDKAMLATTPSRLSLGARGYPWQDSGLAVSLGLDIGTSGTKSFLEETKPETPWMFWLGLGYGIDTVPPTPKIVEVTAATPSVPAKEIRRYVIGQVVDQASGTPIPDALVRFDAEGFTGMIADKNGYFLSTDLAPGEYKFQVHAAEYRPGTCSVVVPETLAAAAKGAASNPSKADSTSRPLSADASAAVTTGADAPVVEGGAVGGVGVARPATAEPEVNADGDYEIPVRCEMKELPKVANVIGLVIDAKTGTPISDATVTITDRLNRSLTLAGDAQGSLLFKNVVFGSAQLLVNAPGYLPSVAVVNITSRKEVTTHVALTPRPSKLGVSAGPRQLKLPHALEFVGETKELTAESTAVLEEIAAFLVENPAPAKIEVAVHSDDSGAASYSRRLTQDRADYVRDLLVRLGVEASRLTAKGYGPDEPLTANVSDQARAKNRRTEFRISK